MKNALIFVIAFMFSCTSLEKELETHLKNGLTTYYHTREVNLNFVPGISLKRLAIIKKNNEDNLIVIRLNDNVSEEQILKYSLAIKIYLNEEKNKNILKGKKYFSNPIKPNILAIGEYKYIITPFPLDTKKVKQIEFFLFDRDKFRKVLGKPVFVKNINIK